MRQIFIVIITLAFSSMFILGCNNSKEAKVSLELYASPKYYSCSMLFNNGVFNYELNKKDIIKSKEDCCFGYNDQSHDSIVTMCYRRFILEKGTYDSLFYFDYKIDDSFFISPPCALFLIKKNNGKLDSIFIDRSMNFKRNGKVFKSSKRLDDFFYKALSTELKENWAQ
jgi:hypothetical protein